jgi:tetratricopeptide (TPR) repeat protein
MKYLILSLFTIACASSQKKQEGGGLTNSDFKKPSQVAYKKDQDQFGSNKSELKLNSVFANESVMMMSKSEQDDVTDQGNKLSQALIKCHQEQVDTALAELVAIGKNYQKHPVYWNTIGVCYLISNNFEKALMFLNKALDVYPDYTPALNNLGVMLLKDGSPQKAMVAFERAVKSSAFSLTPRLNLAMLHLRYYQVDQALQYILPLYENNPSEVELINAMAFASLVKGDYAKSIGYYRQLKSEQLETARIGLNFALALIMHGDKKAARDIYEDIEIENEPSYQNEYSKIGSML